MAVKRATKAKAAGPESKQPRSMAAQRAAESDGDYSHYLDKAPTDLQERFAEWLQSDAVGFDPTAAKTKAVAFSEGVRLGVALRMKFQASPENQEVLEEQRMAREEEAAKPKAKRSTKKAKVAPEEDSEEDLEEDDDLEPEDSDEEGPEANEEEPEEEPEPKPKPRRASRARATSGTASATAVKGKRPARRTAATKNAPAPF
jgi:hypothetical protein